MSSVGKSSRPVTWTDKRRGKTPTYKYFTLTEIYDERCTRSTQCNVYGIVTDFKEPTKSRGSDYFSLVFIVDRTSQQPLKIRLFHRDSSFFPEVHLGDIVRFHRLKVYKPSSDIKDVLLTSTKGWSWVLWKSTIAGDLLNHGKSSSESYTLLDSDKEKLESLRAWQQGHPAERLARPYENKNKRISGVKHGDHFTLLCQVIAVKKLSDSQLALKVWDGTKPTQKFEPVAEFTAEDAADVDRDVPNDYIVDVTIHDDHVAVWEVLALSEGSFVVLQDLHAWPNPGHPANASGRKRRWQSSELVLHSGTAYGRGIRIVGESEDLMTDVTRDIGTVKAFVSDDNAEKSQTTQDVAGTLDLLQQLEKEVIMETGMEPQQMNEEDDIPECSTGANKGADTEPETAAEDYVTATSSLSSAQSSQASENNVADEIIRCLQESVTVVTGGDGVPQKLTNLKKVLKCEVTLHRSKLFRVRVHVAACMTPDDSYVVHICPVTGVNFPATNTGEPLKVSQKVEDFVKAWRQVRGIDLDQAPVTDDDLDLIDIPNSQWDLPGADGGISSVNIKRYVCEKDGSKWDSMEMDDHVIRKRKHDGDRFTIMYKCTDSPNYDQEALKEWGKKYDRVIRLVPIELQLSRNPPAVGYQDGVFYYSSPPYVVRPTLPSLKKEAEMFDDLRISHAMGSPTLVPRIMLNLTLSEGSDRLENVWLMGRSAVEFFGVTPQDCLVDQVGCATNVKKWVSALTEKADWLECIIEKKSRKRRGSGERPFYVYSICNTKLKEDYR